jgi:hypothetical protein
MGFVRRLKSPHAERGGYNPHNRRIAMGDPGTRSPSQAAPPASPTAGERHSRYLIPNFWKFAVVVAIVMIVLALLGVGLTSARSTYALTYWVALVPVYGLACVLTAWRRAALSKHSEGRLVIRQVLHWTGIAAALGFDFLIRGSGEETAVAAGLNALLLLALGCYLAGIHFERLFVLVGILLSIIFVIVTKTTEYLWLVFVIGGIAVAALLAVWWLIDRRARRARGAAPAATGS